MDYISRIEKFFWDSHENDELMINESNIDHLDQALRLLDLAELKGKDTVNSEIALSEELKKLFHFEETLNVIEESTDNDNSIHILEGEIESYPDSELESFSNSHFDFEPNFRMNREEPQFNHPGESSYKKRRRTNQDHGSTPLPNLSTGNPNQFGTNVLNIDNILKNRREVIDRWASEISLIVQTNREKYSTKGSILLLFEHKTSGVIQKFIKNTNWTGDYTRVFQDVLDAIYMMFLGIDLVTDKAKEQQKEIEKAKTRLTNLTICDICFLDQFTCDYEENLFIIGEINQYPEMIKQYLLKIPIVGQQSLERFLKESTNATLHSLAFAKKIVTDEIQKICSLSNTQKRLKRFNKNCCSHLTNEKPFKYGCKTSS